MPSAPASPTPRRRPPGRYDEPSRTAPRAVAVVLAVLLVGFLVAVAWSLFQRYAGDRIALQLQAFDVRSDDEVVVEFEVTPPEGTRVWCLVRSRGEAGQEVGSVFVPVDPREDGRPVRVRQELSTSARAVTGEVPRCVRSAPPAGEPTADPVSP